MSQAVRPVLMRLAAMCLVVAALSAWPTLATGIDCAATALLVLPLWWLLALAVLEQAYLRRYAFVAHYLCAGSQLRRLLRPGWLLIFWVGLKSLAFALFLLTALLFFDSGQSWLLCADVVLLAALLWLIGHALRGEVHEVLRQPLARAWSRRCNAGLLWLAWLAQMLYAPRQNYLGLSWPEVVDDSVARVVVRCAGVCLAPVLAWRGAELVDGGTSVDAVGRQRPDRTGLVVCPWRL
jgi:hypothetical protein